MPAKIISFEPSSIETIDSALYEWVKDLELHTKTNLGWEKTQIIWLGAERAFQIKNNKELRDDSDRIILPVITVSRDSLAKDMSFRGAFHANVQEHPDYKGGAITITKRIKQDKTRNFANADTARLNQNADETGRTIKNSKVVFQEITIPAPVYVTAMYDINIKTEYQQQMNSLVQPFITKIGQINGFFIEKDGHKYEAFIEQDFNETKNIKDLGEDERIFETNVRVKVLGHLIGEGQNREKPKVSIRENRVQVRISRERVITGDKRPWIEDDFDYRD